MRSRAHLRFDSRIATVTVFGLALMIALPTVLSLRLPGEPTVSRPLVPPGQTHHGIPAPVRQSGSEQFSAWAEAKRATIAPGVSVGWSNLSASVGAGPLVPAVMGTDDASGSTVLVGGASGTETWTFSAGVWRNLTPSLSVRPGTNGADPRGYGMAYDAQDGYFVLFGGAPAAGSYPGNQTWIFKSGTWTELNLTAAPSPRSYAAMAYDARDGYVMLFGGSYSYLPSHQPGPSDSGVTFNETWAFSAGHWAQLHPTLFPSARSGAAMAFDPLANAIILFGGSVTNTTAPDDTWEFAGGNWTQLSPAQAPPQFWGAAMVTNPADNHLLLHEPGPPGTWDFSQGSWTNVSGIFSPAEPPGLEFQAMAFDPSSYRVILTGGNLSWDAANSRLNRTPTETWAWTSPSLQFFSLLTANRTAIDVGQRVAFNLTVIGGVPPFTVNFSGLPASCAPILPTSFSCLYNLSGSFAVVASVEDSNGSRAPPASVAIVVNPALSLTANASIAGGVERTVLVSASATGGTPPLTYNFAFGDGSQSASGNWPVSTHTYSSGGPYMVGVSVSDATRSEVNWSGWVIVPSPLTVVLSASPHLVSFYVNVSLSAELVGGVPPYSFAWTGLPWGCLSADAPTLVCRPTAFGLFQVSIAVRDAVGGVAAAATTITVASPLNASMLVVYGTNCQRPSVVSLAAYVAGGWGPYVYNWSWGDGTFGSIHAPQVDYAYSSAGNYTASVHISDASGQSVYALGLVQIPNPLCNASPSPSGAASVPWWEGTAGWLLLGAGIGAVVGVLATMGVGRYRT